MTDAEFVDQALANKTNEELLRRLPALELQQCHLTAGCLFQTVWNLRSARTATADIKDYDVFYFDADCISEEDELAVNRRGQELVANLGVTLDIKNQARVHLWYEEFFGSPYPKLESTQDGMARFLVACTCVGIDCSTREVFAPHGFDEMENGLLRINPLNNTRPDLFRRKAESYRARWSWLKILAPYEGRPL